MSLSKFLTKLWTLGPLSSPEPCSSAGENPSCVLQSGINPCASVGRCPSLAEAVG